MVSSSCDPSISPSCDRSSAARSLWRECFEVEFPPLGFFLKCPLSLDSPARSGQIHIRHFTHTLDGRLATRRAKFVHSSNRPLARGVDFGENVLGGGFDFPLVDSD